MKNLFGRDVGIWTSYAVLAVIQAVAVMNYDSALPSTTWPNEPAGYTVVTDIGFNSTTEGGWNLIFTSPTSLLPCGQTTCIPITDATAPFSPTNVMTMVRPLDGLGGGKFYKDFSRGYVDMYVGFRWKPSNPYWGWANANNKIMGVVNASNTASTWMRFTGPNGGPYTLIMYLSSLSACNGHLPGWGDPCGTWNLRPNLASGAVSLGVWHLVEFYFKQSTTETSRDGIARWWLDGVKQGEYTNVNFPNDPGHYTHTFIGPSWDQIDPTQKTVDSQLWDHFRISVPSGGASSDTVLPLAPTGLAVR